MSSDIKSMIAVLVVLLAFMGGLAWLRKRFSIEGEISRKGVHLGMGCVALAFPWIFERSWPVGLLAVLSCLTILGLVCIPAFKAVLKSVDRESYGEMYFPLAVAFVFHFSKGDPVLYCPPMLMLTFGDTMAAVVGKRFARFRYATHEGSKSWIGSMAFLVSTFVCVSLCLFVLSEFSALKILLLAFLFGLIGLMTEGLAWKGLDNLLLPIFGLVAIEAFRGLTVSELSLRILVLIGIGLICFSVKRRSTMNDGALLGVALILYLIWAKAGLYWAISPFVVFLLFPRVVKFEYSAYRNHQSVPALVGVFAIPFLWFAQLLRDEEPYVLVWPYSLALAIHLSVIWSKRARSEEFKWYKWGGLIVFPFLSVVVVQAIPIGLSRSFHLDWGFAQGSLLSVILCSIISTFVVFDRSLGSGPQITLKDWSFRLAFIAGASSLLYATL